MNAPLKMQEELAKSNTPVESKPHRLPYPRQAAGIRGGAGRTFIWITAIATGAFLVWASTTKIDRVTRGTGRVIPQLQNQIVQHFEGGIVTDILVREGESVKQGTPLLRIDNSFSRSELAQATIDIKAKRVQMVRLAAEAGGEDVVTFPPELMAAIPAIVDRERELFDGRRHTLTEQLAILDDQYRQKSLELSETKSRWTNTGRERELVQQRVMNLRKLADIGAFSTNDLLENERTLQQIEQRLSDLVHEIPRLEAAMSEINRRMREAKLRFKSEADKDRSETEVHLAKLMETVSALKDRSLRSEVLAPIDGIVNKLHVSTVGGVVKSGEPLVEIVPIDEAIAVEARLMPADRAEVWPGQKAVVKVSAYDFSTYGGLAGKVVDISPDALQDERGQPYFRVRLEAAAKDFGPGKPIVPGMLADVDILIGRRTVMDSLIRPVRDLRDNALRF